MAGNPGFEYEILFASGNSGGVYVNDVDGVAAHNQITNLKTYNDGVNDQRAYARFSNCTGTTDPIFIDFFIAFADLGASVTSNSTLRMVFASASSANSALNGSASDVGGIADGDYPDDDSMFETYVAAVPTIQFSTGYSSIVDVDNDGVDDATDNCVDLTACNYDGSVNNVACTYATTWYADTDSDGFGDASNSTSACTQPAGYVSNSTDCDDSNGSVNALDACGVCGGPGATTWYRDADNDGYGDAGDSQQACSAPAGYVATSGDCDDTDNSINPGAVEACDGVDNDCDASVDEGVLTTWYRDADNDGYGDAGDSQQACTQPAGYVSNSTDCDDSNGSVNALDACGVCGGPGATTWYADDDSDGLGDASDSQQACSAPAGYVADSSDLCDDLAASNYADNPTAPCTYAAATYTRLDSTFACENQAVYSMDLDTMHAGTGAWSYTLVEDIVGFGSATINSNLVSFDLSAAGIGRDTIAISGTDGAETASIQIIVQESATYPYVTGVLSDGSSHSNAEDGGAVFSFAGHDSRPVTVHYYEDAVMIFDGGTNKFAGYGDLQSAQSDANGNWASHASQAIWIAGYTNAYGCYSPEPATSGTPTTSPKLKHLPIPHLVD
jgi:hypothetical protein